MRARAIQIGHVVLLTLFLASGASAQEVFSARASQTISIGTESEDDATPTACQLAVKAVPTLKPLLDNVVADTGVVVGWPVKFGRHGAKCLYGQGGFSAFGRLAATISEDQQVASADVISGAIGAIPVSLTTMLITTKSSRDSVSKGALDAGGAAGASGAGAGDMVFVDGLASRLTALTRNGGNLTFHAYLPLFVSVGPNMRWTHSVGGGLGVVGSLDESDSLVGSYTMSTEGSLSFTIRGAADDNVLGSVLVPYRLARVGTWGDLVDPGMLDDPTVTLPDNGLWVFQSGFALTDKNDRVRGGITLTYPLGHEAAKSAIPRFGVNLRLFLAPVGS